MKRPRTAPTNNYRWSIYRLRGTPAAYVGSVEATDENAAIKAAIKDCGMEDPAQQKRLLGAGDARYRRRNAVETIEIKTHVMNVPADLLSTADHYALEVRGDSMIEAGILEGDIALIVTNRCCRSSLARLPRPRQTYPPPMSGPGTSRQFAATQHFGSLSERSGH